MLVHDVSLRGRRSSGSLTVVVMLSVPGEKIQPWKKTSAAISRIRHRGSWLRGFDASEGVIPNNRNMSLVAGNIVRPCFPWAVRQSGGQ
jgi:hypothetical protein